MMKKAQDILYKFPEYYFIVLIVLAGYTPPFYFNPIYLGLALIPLLQLIFKNNKSGILIGGVFFLGNLLMLGALLAEFRGFSEFNFQAKQLLFGGLLIWILNMISSGIMLFKYTKAEIVIKPEITPGQN